MALMQWSDDLSVGVAVIDADHKKLIAMVNTLFEGVREGKGRDAVGAILDGLITYTVEHFNREEKLFAQTGYPLAAEHRAQHEKLKEEVLAIQQKYAAGKSYTITLETMNFLKAWLVNHIQGSDQKYRSHLASHGIH